MDRVGFVYILRCADGKYYVGPHRGTDVMTRVSEHNLGVSRTAWTYSRRPVECVWSESFDRFDEMVAFERQIKGWNRKKKEALIKRDWDALPDLSKRASVQNRGPRPSRPLGAAPQDEVMHDNESSHLAKAGRTTQPQIKRGKRDI